MSDQPIFNLLVPPSRIGLPQMGQRCLKSAMPEIFTSATINKDMSHRSNVLWLNRYWGLWCGDFHQTR